MNKGRILQKYAKYFCPGTIKSKGILPQDNFDSRSRYPLSGNAKLGFNLTEFRC